MGVLAPGEKKNTKFILPHYLAPGIFFFFAADGQDYLFSKRIRKSDIGSRGSSWPCYNRALKHRHLPAETRLPSQFHPHKVFGG